MPLRPDAMPSVVKIVTQLGQEATLYTVFTLIIFVLLLMTALKVKYN
jgi:hypothetical protein